MADELFHADGQLDRQTDMVKITVTFQNFANAPKNTDGWIEGHCCKTVNDNYQCTRICVT